MRIRKPLGIDLGTTNSVIALLDATNTGLLTAQDEQGRKTFPSVVGYHPGLGRLVAGRAALALKTDCGNVPLPLSSVKRFMGLDRPFALGPETLTPPQVSARVLEMLRDALAATLGDPRYLLDPAVITMPAYFNHNQIEATREAGQLAGFEVLELLHEPTAAAIFYSWAEGHGDATYLVYDLGGGTFDVSLIRKRFGDYEVLGVSGDPFLGGDDFDRLLASHLVESSKWTVEEDPNAVSSASVSNLMDLTMPTGAANFARLVHVAEGIKIALTETECVERYVPRLVRDAEGREISLEARVDRSAFHRLIRDKVDRTIDCCHEALGRAQEKAGLRLADVDYVVLVGGSSRVPLVRETVRAAFCNPDLPERGRCPEPLLHEPDLCVAYGAALRAATYGTRYVFSSEDRGSRIEDGLELHVTSPPTTSETDYQLTGIVRLRPILDPPSSILHPPSSILHSRSLGETNTGLEGYSLRTLALATGLIEETFLEPRGSFVQDLRLEPETDNAFELTVCDTAGREMVRLPITVRQQTAARSLGPGVLPTQLLTKPLQIEVLNRGRQRVKQVVAPVGATLPNTFRCTCRTRDQAGRVVVPIFEENRIIKQMVIDGLDPSLPVGSPVDVELAIDVTHNVTVRVLVRSLDGETDRCETAAIEAPPPPRRPTRAEIDEVQRQINELLPRFSGRFRTRLRGRATQVVQDLLEALRYDDEPKAIQRMAELRDLLERLEAAKGQALDPPWPRFTGLVRRCLDLAAEVAKATGRVPDELFEHVYAQERYAEQAYEEQNAALYRECNENLEKYAAYLEQLLRDTLPRPLPQPIRPPEEEARDDLDRFRSYLAHVWKQVRQKGRPDLEPRLAEVARQAQGLAGRLKTDPHAVTREARRLGTEVSKVEDLLTQGRRPPSGDDAGLLEGSS
jgi:molecular chaperone DnaK